MNADETDEYVEAVKEIVNCSEEDILAMLRECRMDPHEAVNRLLNLNQDAFHEVKSKRGKKKETKEIPEPRQREASTSNRGSRTAQRSDPSSSTSNRGSRTAQRSDPSSSYHSSSVDNVGQRYSIQGPAICNSQKSLTSSYDRQMPTEMRKPQTSQASQYISWSEKGVTSRELAGGLLCYDGIEYDCLVLSRPMAEEEKCRVLYQFQHNHLLNIQAMGAFDSVEKQRSIIMALHPSIRKMDTQDFKDLFRKKDVGGRRVFTRKGRDFIVHLSAAIECFSRFKDKANNLTHIRQSLSDYTLDISENSIYFIDKGMKILPSGGKERFVYLIGNYLQECKREDQGNNFMRLGFLLKGLSRYAVTSPELCSNLCDRLQGEFISSLEEVEMHPALWSGIEIVTFVFAAYARVKNDSKNYARGYWRYLNEENPIECVSEFAEVGENGNLHDSVVIVRNILCHPSNEKKPHRMIYDPQDRPRYALRELGKHYGYNFIIELARRFSFLGHPAGMM